MLLFGLDLDLLGPNKTSLIPILEVESAAEFDADVYFRYYDPIRHSFVVEGVDRKVHIIY